MGKNASSPFVLESDWPLQRFCSWTNQLQLWTPPLVSISGKLLISSEAGVTTVYSSHYIEEVEHTADRILVLHKGELIRDTTPYAMRSEEQEKHFTLPLTYQSVLEKLDNVTDLEIKQKALSFATRDAGSSLAGLFRNTAAANRRD